MPTRIVMHQPGVLEIQGKADAYRDRLTEDMADDMRRMVPVLSGALHDTIRTDPQPDAARIWVGDIHGVHGQGVVVDYHLYQEYGTSRMGAQPFIRPAVYMRRA